HDPRRAVPGAEDDRRRPPTGQPGGAADRAGGGAAGRRLPRVDLRAARRRPPARVVRRPGRGRGARPGRCPRGRPPGTGRLGLRRHRGHHRPRGRRAVRVAVPRGDAELARPGLVADHDQRLGHRLHADDHDLGGGAVHAERAALPGLVVPRVPPAHRRRQHPRRRAGTRGRPAVARGGGPAVKPLDPRLLRHARATAPHLAVVVALGVATAGLVIAQAGLLARGIAGVVEAGGPTGDLGRVLGWLAVVVAARAAVAWAEEAAAHRASARVKSQLRHRLVARAAELAARRAGGPGRAEAATLAARGLDALDGWFSRYLPQLVLAVVVPVAVLGRLLAADLTATVTVAATLPLIPVFMVLVGLATEAANRRRWRALARLSHHFLDVVTGLPTLKAFGRATAQADAIRRSTDRYRRTTMGTLRIAFLSSLVLELLATLSVALVAVGVGLRLVEGRLDLETGLLVIVLAPEAYLPLRRVGAAHHASAEGLAAAEAAFAVLERPVPERRGQAPPPS